MALTYNRDLTHKVIGRAMRVHSRVGPGLLESAYERCLTHELSKAGIPTAARSSYLWNTTTFNSTTPTAPTLLSETRSCWRSRRSKRSSRSMRRNF